MERTVNQLSRNTLRRTNTLKSFEMRWKIDWNESTRNKVEREVKKKCATKWMIEWSAHKAFHCLRQNSLATKIQSKMKRNSTKRFIFLFFIIFRCFFDKLLFHSEKNIQKNRITTAKINRILFDSFRFPFRATKKSEKTA